MNLQPDLFGGKPVDMRRLADAAPELRTRARRDNPATSKAAAAALPCFATDHHGVIFATMREHGAGGLTVHEVAVYCRLDAHAIGKRMGELEKAGIVETRVIADGDAPDGYTVQTRKTPSGRAARVWFLTEKGRAC